MAVKLYRCKNEWLKAFGHPCWKVQKALDEAGIEYEVVKGPVKRTARLDLQRISGQRLYPVIVFEDGVVYREQARDMAARIRDGKLMEADVKPPPDPSAVETKQYPAAPES